MTTQAVLNKHLTKKADELPFSFMYKGAVKKAVEIEQKYGTIYATYLEGDKPIKVCITLEDLIYKPIVNGSFTIAQQKPKLKVGDYIRIKVKGAKQTDTHLTTHMRTYEGLLSKVEAINSKGFYKLSGRTLQEQGYTESYGQLTIDKYKWSDRWVTKLTAKEYEDELITKPFEQLVKSYAEKTESNTNHLADRVREAGMLFASRNRELTMALELKNKKAEEILKQKKADFIAEIDFIKKDSRVKDVTITGTGVVVTTNPLTYRCTNVAILKDFAYLPAFTMNINLRDNAPVVKAIKDSAKDYTYSCGYHHPHLSSGGNPCLGNMSTPYQMASSKFSVKDTTMILLALLESYHTSNPYVKISGFYAKAPKCKNCKSKNILAECESCGKKVVATKDKYVMPICK